MPHYNAYDSFKTKKSVDKKKRAKEKSFGTIKKIDDNFIVENTTNFGVITEVRYDTAYVLYGEEIVMANLRKDLNVVCNQLLFPGDKVILEKEKDESFTITNMIKRTSILSRIKKDSTRLDDSIGTRKNIATNIDLAVIVVSAKEPPLHPKFIDRYLMILQNSGIQSVICLNKCDLKTEEEEKILEVYRSIGIPVIETSTVNNIGIEDLKHYLRGKQTIFVGNSGVGKSSLTNSIMDDNEIKTSHVSEKSKRGRHTTTTSKYYVWEEDSSIIDTPGIRSLDISLFRPEEIQDYFPEFENWRQKCKYKVCLHYEIPYEDCMVKQAVTSGIINKTRYESYIRLVSSLVSERKYLVSVDDLLTPDEESIKKNSKEMININD